MASYCASPPLARVISRGGKRERETYEKLLLNLFIKKKSCSYEHHGYYTQYNSTHELRATNAVCKWNDMNIMRREEVI